MSFNSDLRRFSKTAGSTAEKMFRAKVIGVMNNIVRRTPVKDGRLQGNWQASINSPKRNTLERTNPPHHAELHSALSPVKSGDVVYFTNNLPYAYAIEMGHSKKNPLGMMRISVLEASD